ncbi:hypothetical protein [Burkholderia ubonensis]|uniref:hypothetical protein n=1 Tax=Burkholderia ubonensis TaxID=101571 RepID=UPI00016A47FD|nr:hypothetical protein [Burkholderia ubonensis]
MNRLFRPLLLTSAAAGLLVLAGCAVQPASTILSRLPEQRASGQPVTLTPAERKRYDEIDRQVLREQNDAIAAEAAIRAWSYYTPPPITYYGGYYGGGWGHGWGTGFSYGYPGWWW